MERKNKVDHRKWGRKERAGGGLDFPLEQSSTITGGQNLGGEYLPR